MKSGLLFDHDAAVAAILFSSYKQKEFKYDRCIGIIDPTGKITGAILLHDYNGNNVELSYYGEKTLSAGIVRCLAQFIVCTFDPSRLTVITSKRRKTLMRSLQRFGFKLEGTQRCYYGKKDIVKNVGVRFVMFREGLDKLAKLPANLEKVA